MGEAVIIAGNFTQASFGISHTERYFAGGEWDENRIRAKIKNAVGARLMAKKGSFVTVDGVDVF